MYDRDPDIFRHILTFYRTGKLHYPRHEYLVAYDEELSFFGIMSDLISDCCYEDYKDKKRENQERLIEETLETGSATMLKQNFQEKLWTAFENPHSTSVSLVFYYVTGFFTAISVWATSSRRSPAGRLPAPFPSSCGDTTTLLLIQSRPMSVRLKDLPPAPVNCPVLVMSRSSCWNVQTHQKLNL